MQQAVKHRKTLEPVWNDLDTFDIGEGAEGAMGRVALAMTARDTLVFMISAGAKGWGKSARSLSMCMMFGGILVNLGNMVDVLGTVRSSLLLV